MNIFRPFEDAHECVAVLDDKRLNKQILECWQIYNINKKLDENPTAKVGYANHPVVRFYRAYPDFVLHYAYMACLEYWLRNNYTDHALHRQIMHAYFNSTEYIKAESLGLRCKNQLISIARDRRQTRTTNALSAMTHTSSFKINLLISGIKILKIIVRHIGIKTVYCIRSF